MTKQPNVLDKFYELFMPVVLAANAENVPVSACMQMIIAAVPKYADNELVREFFPPMYDSKRALVQQGEVTPTSSLRDAIATLKQKSRGRALPKHMPAESTLQKYIDAISAEFANDPDPGAVLRAHAEEIAEAMARTTVRCTRRH